MSDVTQIPGLPKHVREQIYDHIWANEDHEVGGVLVGRLGRSHPMVIGVIPALNADGQRASVTFTHDAWATVHEVLDRDFPGNSIVGWYHSHPGFGIFLSAQDVFIHENFFSGPGQIAYVVDPHAGMEGVFGWSGNEVVELDQRETTREPSRTRGMRHEDPPRRGYSAIGLMLPLILGLAIGLLAAVLLTRGDEPAPATTAPRSQLSTPAPAGDGAESRGEAPRRRATEGPADDGATRTEASSRPGPQVVEPEAGEYADPMEPCPATTTVPCTIER